MRTRALALSIFTLFAIAALAPACDEPGCETVGSTGECPGDYICDDDPIGRSCLAICTKQDDCTSVEECTGVPKTEHKACHHQKNEGGW